MKHYVLHDAAGQIWQTLSTLDSSEVPRVGDLLTLEVEAPVDGQACRVEAGRVVSGLQRPKSASRLAAEVRAHRATLFLASDWTQGNDSPLDVETKAAWAVYRQALRDVTAQPGFPSTVTWPVAPGNAG